MFGSFRALRAGALGFLFAFGAYANALATSLPPAPVPVESFDVGTLHVDRYGSGAQAVVLIPGLGSGPWEWYGTIARFSQTYSVYAISLPGFNGRPATDKTPLFATFSSDFWKMLAARGIVKPIVIGHSLGATLCFALAEQHPERLRAVVAVDGLPVFPMVAQKTPEERAALADGMAARYVSMTPQQTLAYETQFMQTIGTIDPSLVAQTAALEASSDPHAVAAWMKEDLTTDLRPELSRAAVPILEIMPYDPVNGKAMNVTQDASAAFYTALLAGAPNVKVVAIAPARHFAMLDKPDEFYAEVTQFLGTLPS